MTNFANTFSFSPIGYMYGKEKRRPKFALITCTHPTIISLGFQCTIVLNFVFCLFRWRNMMMNDDRFSLTSILSASWILHIRE